MRLIDADALIKRWDEMSVRGRTEFDQEIMVAPSIDICFCRECKWFDSGKNDSEVWSMCTRHWGKYFYVNDDSFCSYGERKDQ